MTDEQGQPAEQPVAEQPEQQAVSRRDFLKRLGVGAGGVAIGGAAGFAVGRATVIDDPERPIEAVEVPDEPLKVGHITFLSGPAAVLGEASLKGHQLAEEEINADGGILGRRLIETVVSDEAAGADAIVREVQRMKLEQDIELFTGIISSGNTPAIGPVAEELGLLTLFNDGCTDFLFDVAVPEPHYTFRITNIQSADGITSAVGAAQFWPEDASVATCLSALLLLAEIPSPRPVRVDSSRKCGTSTTSRRRPTAGVSSSAERGSGSRR